MKKIREMPHLRPVVLFSQRHELGEPDRHAGCPTLEADLFAVQTQITAEAIRIYTIKGKHFKNRIKNWSDSTQKFTDNQGCSSRPDPEIATDPILDATQQ